jgi:hypothetical protein
VPLLFRAVADLGCVAAVRQRTRATDTHFDLGELHMLSTNTQPYLRPGTLRHVWTRPGRRVAKVGGAHTLCAARYLFMSHTQADTRSIVAVFFPDQKRAVVVVVDPYRCVCFKGLPRATTALTSTRSCSSNQTQVPSVARLYREQLAERLRRTDQRPPTETVRGPHVTVGTWTGEGLRGWDPRGSTFAMTNGPPTPSRPRWSRRCRPHGGGCTASCRRTRTSAAARPLWSVACGLPTHA